MDDELEPIYGPTMQKLNERQRAWVIARVWKGYTQTDSAKDAGYSGTHDSMKTRGNVLAHDPNVIEAVREETNKLKDSQGAACIRTLAEIRDDPTTEKKDRIKAATTLFDRAGYNAVSEHHVHVTRKDLSTKEMIAEITALAKKLDVDPRKFLGNAYIDAEFEEVQPKLAGELTKAEKQAAAKQQRQDELHLLRNQMTPEELQAHKQATRQKRSEEAKQIYHHEKHRQEYGKLADVNTIAETVDDDLSDIL